MRKLLLLLFLTLGFLQSTDAQWYYKQFGVHSPDDLSKQQLEMGLKYLQDQRRKTIITYSVVVPALAAGGALLIYKANKSGKDQGSGMVSAVGASLLVISVAGLMPAAATEITIQSVRISKVRRALGNPEVHPGISFCPKHISAQINTVPVYGLSLSYKF